MPNQSNVLNNIPKDRFHLFDGNRVKGEEVARILEWKKKEISQATGVNVSSIRYDAKMPQELKERMREWATTINLVAEFFKDQNKTIRWFFTSNPVLGERTPRDMLRIGRSKMLIKFIRNALHENKPSSR